MIAERPIDVLFIDDDANVRDSLIGEARRRRILIKGVDNLDDGLLELRTNNRIKFIILDGKAYRHRGQVKGTESVSFAFKASFEIPRLAQELNRHLPFCFFTGFADLASDLSGADHVVIDKNEDNATDKLFNYIWRIYADSEEGKLRQQYPTWFDAIDRLNNLQAEQDLRVFLLEKESNQAGNYKQTIRHIRPIMEAVFAKIAEVDSRLVPDGLQQGNQQSLRKAIAYVAGQPRWNMSKYVCSSQSYMPLHLWLTVTALQDAVSTVAMHSYEPSISRYTLSSYADTLADLLLWFSDFMSNRSRS